MKTKFHLFGFVLLLTFIRLAWSKTCKVRTERDEIKNVCCSDYEAKDNDCIACSKGYTSVTGENCRPCPNNMYGARCGYECSCSDFQTCDKVEGCVDVSSKNGTLVITTSDSTTLPQEVDTRSYDENTEKSVQGLLSGKVIVINILSVTLVVLGISLCFIFYKHKMKATITRSQNPSPTPNSHHIAMEERVYDIIYDADMLDEQQLKEIQMSADYLDVISGSNSSGSGGGPNDEATITRSQNPSPTPNSHHIEMEERSYDIINDADMLDELQLKGIQMSADYLDVISGSNSSESGEGLHADTNEIIFKSLSAHQTKILVNKVMSSSLNNSESTLSSGDDRRETTQDYLNPYQSVIRTSPPSIREYLTLATVHNRTGSTEFDKQSGSLSNNEIILQDPTCPKDLEGIGLRRPYKYENFSINVGYAVYQNCLSNKGERESKSCENLKRYSAKNTETFGKDDKRIASNEDKSFDYYNVFKTKSESNIFCKRGSKI